MKICLLGMFGVGKTSLVRRFVEDQFSEKYLSTIGVKVSRKQVRHGGDNGANIDLLIWDIASEDELQQVARSYFRGSHGAIAVYDVTRPGTLENLNDYCQSFLQIAPAARLVFAGNKSDLVERPQPKQSTIDALPKFREKLHFYTSAKSGENVENAFTLLVESMLSHDG